MKDILDWHHSVGNEAVDGCLVTCEGERKDNLDWHHSVGNEAVDGCLVTCKVERKDILDCNHPVKLWMVAWLPVRLRGRISLTGTTLLGMNCGWLPGYL